MAAPSPVSAYLHSATMVNAGIYVLARLHPSLGGTLLWTGLLGTVGVITLVTGAVLAVVQRDLKLTLAYSTVAALGSMTMLLGFGTDEAIGAAIVVLVSHAAYKASLFLVAGNVAHQRGTRDPFGPGAARALPFTAAAGVIAAASMAGVPLLFGFVSKDALFAATLLGPMPAIVVGLTLLAGAALVGAAWIAGLAPFFHAPRLAGPRHEVPWPMVVGPLVLALAGAVLGLAPALLQPLAAPAAAAVAGRPVALELSLWHGLGGVPGAALGLGLVSLGLGTLAYRAIARRLEPLGRLRARLARLAATRAYDGVMRGLQAGAARLTRVVQHGRLHGYIAMVVGTTVVVVGVPLLAWPVGTWKLEVALGPHELPLIVVGAGGALAATALRDRLASVAALAATGLAITFLFALFSGPDLAITQLTVETMMVILLVLVFRRLPPSAARRRSLGVSVGRLIVSVTAGGLVTVLLVIAASPTPFEAEASRAHVALAPGQGSRNVVNAILVNFRAIDTLGEVTVLAIAGLGVLSLLGFWARPRCG